MKKIGLPNRIRTAKPKRGYLKSEANKYPFIPATAYLILTLSNRTISLKRGLAQARIFFVEVRKMLVFDRSSTKKRLGQPNLSSTDIKQKKQPFRIALWELTDSNRRPSACKADALNQLS